MARGGPRVGAGRPANPESRRARQAAKRAAKASAPAKSTPKKKQVEKAATPPDKQAVLEEFNPLDYMLKVMNDPGADQSRRDRMAVAAAPYLHPKVGESGKKAKTQQAAKAAGTGKFAPASPPKLVAVSSR